MTPDPPAPRLTLGDLANWVLAAGDRATRVPLVTRLARGTRTADQVAAVADHFLAAGPAGQRALLEFAARHRAALPAAVAERIIPLLSGRTVSVAVRVAAAAHVLRSLPDRPDTVKAVARAVAAGLSPLRRLERLRHLQHHLKTSRGLDALIERRERRVKMDCPRCGVRLPRVAMIRHLWAEHGLMLEGGKVRSPWRTVEDLKAAHADTRDTTVLDRASLLADAAALRAWAAATDPPADDVAPLRATAEEHRAGLCPGCFAELPGPVAPLPPPLAVAGGRLAGDGYVVEVGGAEWFRTLTVATPAQVLRAGPDRGRVLGPRGAATLAAGVVLLVAAGVALFLPPAVAAPRAMAFWLIALAALVYGAVWYTRKPLPNPAERAADAAWSVLARRLVSGERHAVWLARLCRTSVGRGDWAARAGVLHQVVERAAAGADDADDELRLLAVASVLRVEDAARLGRDRVAEIAAVAGQGFGEAGSTAFAEHVAECVLHRGPPPGDAARFRVLLLAAAFDAGLTPRDLLDLWGVAPNLRRAMGVEPLHRLGLLHGVWQMRAARRWERVAPAESVFDLCRIAPNVSGRVLGEFPDLLLYHRPDAAVEDQLGAVLVCARGVAVGGRLVADPDAPIQLARAGRFGGGYELTFGPHLLRLARRPPDDFADTLRRWLQFRVTVLLPHIEGYLVPGKPGVAARVLAPFRRQCPQCGTVSAVAVGKVGVPVE